MEVIATLIPDDAEAVVLDDGTLVVRCKACVSGTWFNRSFPSHYEVCPGCGGSGIHRLAAPPSAQRLPCGHASEIIHGADTEGAVRLYCRECGFQVGGPPLP